MIYTPARPCTYAEYLCYDDGTDNRYELVRGELISMPPPIIQHLRLAKFIERCFDDEIEQRGQDWECLREAGQRVNPDTVRLIDVVVTTKADADALNLQTTIFQAPVLLAVEIVSSNWRDDYVQKFTEYEALGIPEYWIVDHLALGAAQYLASAKQPTISVCQWVAGKYQVQRFQGQDHIISMTFPDLCLTVDQLLSCGPSRSPLV